MSKPYFKIVAQGFNEELKREQIEIEASTGKIVLFKTDDGFSVEVYDVDDEDESVIHLIDSMIINDAASTF
jgi:hypothetical protein